MKRKPSPSDLTDAQWASLQELIPAAGTLALPARCSGDFGAGYNGIMSTNNRLRQATPPRWYRGADVPLSVIRRFARQVAERFQPDKIILFGSYAYGTPHADSDVDILVVMPARNELDQSAKISLAIDPPFPLDIIVRTPKNMQWRLEEGDSFLREIVSKGTVLYEKADGRVGAKGRERLPTRRQTRPGKRSFS